MSNAIKIGNLTIDSFKVGAADCSIYLGTTKLYPQGEPPTFEGKYKLTLSDSSVVSAECDGTSAITEVEISAYTSTTVAAEIGDCVSEIGDSAFAFCGSLTNIDIPSSVTSIGGWCFNGCTSLNSITIPSGVTSIGKYTFSSCRSLTSIAVPNSVASIDDYAFQNCTSLTSCTIGSGVTTIGQWAFENCTSLTNIDIPSSVTSIGGYAFFDCTGLTSCTIGSGVTSIGSGAFGYCNGLTSITVNATTPPALGYDAFSNTNNCPIYVPCESVEAYKSATGWSDYASRITCIPAFEGKYKLTLNDGSVVSAACDGSSVLMRNEISAYSQTCVEAVVGDCVTALSNTAFGYFHNLSSVTISDSVVNIYGYAFPHCFSLTSIGGKGSGASIELPTGLTTIEDSVFEYCTGLTSVMIPSSITKIGYATFGDCTSLPSIEIPNNVSSIDAYAFANCTNLQSVTVNATTPPALGGYAFNNTNNCPIYVPAESVETYKAASGWSTYASRIQAIP